MNRSTALTTAESLINGPRAKDYGDARTNFQRIADLWAPVLGTGVTPEQVALCLTQLKVARLIQSPAHEDSWVDAAGYIALGAEIATTGPEPHPAPASPAEDAPEAAEKALGEGVRVRVSEKVKTSPFISHRAGRVGTVLRAGDAGEWWVLLDGDNSSHNYYTDELEVIA